MSSASQEFLRNFLRPSESSQLRLGGGIVTAYDGVNKLVTVDVDGSGVEVPGLRHMSAYTPSVNDVVVLLKNGGDWWVWDKFA
jgi:hypothetical protein